MARKTLEIKNRPSWLHWVASGAAAAVVALTAGCSPGEDETQSQPGGPAPSVTVTAELGRGTIPAQQTILDCRPGHSPQSLLLDGRVNGTDGSGHTVKGLIANLVWSASDFQVISTNTTQHLWIGAVHDTPDHPGQSYYNAKGNATLTDESPTPQEFGALKHYAPNQEITGEPILTLPDGKGTTVGVYTTSTDFVLKVACSTAPNSSQPQTLAVAYPAVQYGA